MKNIPVAVLAVATLAFSVSGWAEPQEYSLEIARQPLAETLREFSKQTALSISFLRKDHQQEEIIVGPLKGRYTAESALEALLANSGMTFIRVNESTIAVTTMGARDGLEGRRVVRTRKTAKEAEPRYFHGADQSSAREGDLVGDTQQYAQVQQAGVGRAGDRNLTVASRGRNSLEEVVTTGSRLRSGEGEEPSPVIVFNRRRIEELGASSLPDVLKYSTQQPFMGSETNTINGAQFAQLRGLPVGTTTVLINGRRTVANNQSVNGIDLNMIPVGAIERVEVLADSASAVYGADAVGGVVNVILRKDITHPAMEVHYGSANGGAEEFRASLMAGHSTDRFRVSVVADYFDRNPLLGRERDRWSDQDYRRFAGGTDARIANANPGAVTSATSANLTGLPSRFALTRPGSTGVNLTAADFISVPTAADLRSESRSRFEPIVLDQDRRSAAAFAEFDFGSAITGFAEAYYTDTQVIDQPRPAIATLNVPSNNPFNPFNQAVTVQYLFEGVGPRRSTIDSDMYGATVGFKGRLSSWDWEISTLRGKSTSLLRQNENAVINTAQANCLLTNPATRAPGACGGITEALNVFQDGPGGSPALLASLVAAPSIFPGKAKITQTSAFLRGGVFDLPAGSAEMAVGGSTGSETGGNGERHRSSSAAFAEIRVPLVGAAMNVPAVEELFVKLAGRYDHYSDFGDTFNPQYGLVWAPAGGLSLTASYGTSFSPPSLFKLFSPRQTNTNFLVTDPARSETASISLFAGGNRNLEAEEGRSFIGGFVWSPQRLPDLRLSAHYWKVVLDDRATGLSYLQILANESLFSDRVVRGAPLPTDPPGRPGPLLSVDQSTINFARLQTSGIDWAASCSFDTPWGRFSPSLSATWVNSYEAKDSPGIPAQERVGLAHFDGTIPKWYAVATLAWANQGVGLSLTTRYTDAYADSAFGPTGILVPTGREVPSQTLVDLHASIDIDDFMSAESLLTDKLKISAGVSNLFDKEPPFALDLLRVGYDPSQGNLIGRVFYINLSKGF